MPVTRANVPNAKENTHFSAVKITCVTLLRKVGPSIPGAILFLIS